MLLLSCGFDEIGEVYFDQGIFSTTWTNCKILEFSVFKLALMTKKEYVLKNQNKRNKYFVLSYWLIIVYHATGVEMLQTAYLCLVTGRICFYLFPPTSNLNNIILRLFYFHFFKLNWVVQLLVIN